MDARCSLLLEWRSAARQIGALLVMACVPALVAAFFHPLKPAWSPDALSPGEIHLRDVLALSTPVLWIDARPRTDYLSEHIPGALPLNLDEWDDLLPEVLHAWQPGMTVVVYCSSRGCHASHEVADHLRRQPLPEVYVLKGGWETWKEAQK